MSKDGLGGGGKDIQVIRYVCHRRKTDLGIFHSMTIISNQV